MRLGHMTHPHGPDVTHAGRLVAAVTAVFFIGAGVLHLSAAADHTNLPVMMAGFLAVAVVQAGFGGLLLWRRPEPLLLTAGVALMLTSVGIWLVSRTAGLPFLPGGHMEPIGFKDAVTVLFELASVPGLLLLSSKELLDVRLPSARLGTQTLAGISTAAFLLFVPALMLGGGHHHSRAELAAHTHGDEPGAAHAHEGEQLASAGAAGHEHGAGAAASEQGTGHAAAGHAHGDGAALTALDGSGSGHVHGGSGSGQTRGDSEHRHESGSDGGKGHAHDNGETGTDGGGTHQHGGTQGGGGHQHGGTPGGGTGHDHGQPRTPVKSFRWGAYGMDLYAAEAREGEGPGKGPTVAFRGPANASQGMHPQHGACSPTPAEKAAADRLYRETKQELAKYERNPGRAIADGFWWFFGPTDRIIHMINPERVFNHTVGDPHDIETFLYSVTDRGLVPIGGMFVMPEPDMPGPALGGCLTKWHDHGPLVAAVATLGTMRRTPEMLHVWTYPGLDPWAHYDGATVSQLWAPTRAVPNVCRHFGDASDACL
jgi:hypothetical protein